MLTMIPVRENSEVVIIYPVYIDEYSTSIYIYGKWSIEIDSLPVKIGWIFHGKLLVITRWQPLWGYPINGNSNGNPNMAMLVITRW